MVWIFGYGSLVWKVGFPFKRKLVGYVQGYIRRFFWWSLDHRGVPGAPGRVVNLLESDKNEKVWGVAYEVEDSIWEAEIEKQLDHREKGGYNQNVTKFYPKIDDTEGKDLEPFNVIAYIGKVTDKQYAGPAPLEEMAKTIFVSVGPSGPNKEYLYNLANALDELGIIDEHVQELTKAVKILDIENCDS